MPFLIYPLLNDIRKLFASDAFPVSCIFIVFWM